MKFTYCANYSFFGYLIYYDGFKLDTLFKDESRKHKYYFVASELVNNKIIAIDAFKFYKQTLIIDIASRTIESKYKDIASTQFCEEMKYLIGYENINNKDYYNIFLYQLTNNKKNYIVKGYFAFCI